MGALLVPPFVKTSSTVIGVRSSSITELQLNSGMTIHAGTSSSDSLTIKANTAAFTDQTTGKINVNYPIAIDGTFTAAGSGGIASLNYIALSGTITTAIGITQVRGFLSQHAIEYSVAQVLASNATFLCKTIVRPTASVTDTASQQWGFDSKITVNPTASSITATVSNLAGFHSAPRITKGASATAITVTNVMCYATNVNEFLVNDITDATITNYYHFYTNNPARSGSNTISNWYGLAIANLPVGGTATYGVYSALASNAKNWFIYGSADAQSVHLGKFSFGKTAAPSVDVDINGAVAYGKSTVSLTADNQAVATANISYISLSSNNATASNRDFVLNQSTVAGHRLILEWTGTNAGLMIDDVAQGGGGNTRLSANWVPTQYDTLHLISNGTDWIETGRSTN
jgi:hypothetical protein